MAASPLFGAVPNVGVGSLTTATGATELGTAAPTNGATVFTANTVRGSNAKRWRIKARNGATVAGFVRLFYVIGGVYYIWQEVAITALTASATVASYDSGWLALDLNLPPGATLHATTTQTHNLSIIVEGTDF